MKQREDRELDRLTDRHREEGEVEGWREGGINRDKARTRERSSILKSTLTKSKSESQLSRLKGI